MQQYGEQNDNENAEPLKMQLLQSRSMSESSMKATPLATIRSLRMTRNGGVMRTSPGMLPKTGDAGSSGDSPKREAPFHALETELTKRIGGLAGELQNNASPPDAKGQISMASLHVYEDIFARTIAISQARSPLLQRIKDGYDGYVDDVNDKLAQALTDKHDLESQVEALAVKVAELERSSTPTRWSPRAQLPQGSPISSSRGRHQPAESERDERGEDRSVERSMEIPVLNVDLESSPVRPSCGTPGTPMCPVLDAFSAEKPPVLSLSVDVARGVDSKPFSGSPKQQLDVAHLSTPGSTRSRSSQPRFDESEDDDMELSVGMGGISPVFASRPVEGAAGAIPTFSLSGGGTAGASALEKIKLEHNTLEQGQPVEARFGGDPVYYPGTIEKMNFDGTYAILYEDGDREARVKRELIRAIAEPVKIKEGGDGAEKDNGSPGGTQGRSLSLALAFDDDEDDMELSVGMGGISPVFASSRPTNNVPSSNLAVPVLGAAVDNASAGAAAGAAGAAGDIEGSSTEAAATPARLALGSTGGSMGGSMKLGLDLDFSKLSDTNYQDEFMATKDQWSLSWREADAGTLEESANQGEGQ
jgi:hypothetical protein